MAQSGRCLYVLLSQPEEIATCRQPLWVAETERNVAYGRSESHRRCSSPQVRLLSVSRTLVVVPMPGRTLFLPSIHPRFVSERQDALITRPFSHFKIFSFAIVLPARRDLVVVVFPCRTSVCRVRNFVFYAKRMAFPKKYLHLQVLYVYHENKKPK